MNPSIAQEFDLVRPKTGVLARALQAIENPRKHRWKAFLRACRRIPKKSPVHGCTSFERLNARRLALIEAMWSHDQSHRRAAKESPEFKALQAATSEWLAGPRVAENFILSRYLRLLKRRHSDT